jgi:hypothetical protein
MPQSSTRWHAHLHVLATPIHETSGLAFQSYRDTDYGGKPLRFLVFILIM